MASRFHLKRKIITRLNKPKTSAIHCSTTPFHMTLALANVRFTDFPLRLGFTARRLGDRLGFMSVRAAYMFGLNVQPSVSGCKCPRLGGPGLSPLTCEGRTKPDRLNIAEGPFSNEIVKAPAHADPLKYGVM